MEIQTTEDLTIKCENCGRYVDGYQKMNAVDKVVFITPCEHCLREANNTGYDEAKNEFDGR